MDKERGRRSRTDKQRQNDDSSDPRLKLWAIGAEGIHPDKFDA